MKDQKLQTFFEGAMGIADRLSKLEAVRAAAAEALEELDYYLDGAGKIPGECYQAENLRAALKALEGEKDGED